MNVIGGRGGLITTFLGLFIFLAIGCAYLLFYTFVAAVGIVYYVLMGIRWLYRRHKAGQVTAPSEPPAPVMSKVAGPRDWTPGNTR